MLVTTDVERAVAWYGAALGFREAFRWPAEGALEFAYLALEPLGIGISSAAVPTLHDGLPPSAERRGFELCIETEDIDAAAARLRAAGAPILVGPVDQPWGERILYTRDPDGTPILVTMPAPRADGD
jgi:lactoylglutathione lyase